MSNETIEIENVGPIKRLTIPIPPDGGVVVLHGRNGVGKTTGIQASTTLMRGDRRQLSVRDGQHAGRIIGAGVTITVARSTRRTGELAVETLDGKFDVTHLIDPGQQDPAKADAARIKAMISLGGFKATPQLFEELLDGKEEFEAVVPDDVLDTDDLIEMARRVKAAIEKAARVKESAAGIAQSAADANLNATEGIDITAEHDEEKLSTAVEAALGAKSVIQRDIEHAQDRASSVKDAQEALDQAVEGYHGIGLNDAEHAVNEAACDDGGAELALDKVTAAISKLQNELRLREQEASAAQDKLKAARQIRDAAKAHQEAIAGWMKTIKETAPVADEAALEVTYREAAGVLNHARQAMEAGVVIRNAIKQRQEAGERLSESANCLAAGTRLRQAADGTYQVLSRLVAGGTIDIKGNGRLVTQTDRGETFFNDLSDGERTRLGLEYAIGAVGEGGLFCLSQEYWQGLDHANRLQVREQLRGTKVVMLAAQADDGELRAEEFTEDAEHEGDDEHD